MYMTTIRCPDCDVAFEVPIDKGTIVLDCACGNKVRLSPFEYSTLAEVRDGSYYLPDFEQNLPRFNLELADTEAQVLSDFELLDSDPFRQLPIPERNFHNRHAQGFLELHGLRVLAYIYFFDTLEIYTSTTSYILDRQDERVSTVLMEKLKYIVSTKYGDPDTVIPVGLWKDYYWHMNYGLAYLSRSPENQVMLQLKYKSYLKFVSQSELMRPSEETMQRVNVLNLEANESGLRGKYEKCIEKSKEALELWPSNANARLLIGTALLESGDTLQAELYLQSAIEYMPQMVSPYFTLGRLYLQTGRNPLAKDYLESYLYICEHTGLDEADPQYPIAKELVKEIDQNEGLRKGTVIQDRIPEAAPEAPVSGEENAGHFRSMLNQLKQDAEFLYRYGNPADSVTLFKRLSKDEQRKLIDLALAEGDEDVQNVARYLMEKSQGEIRVEGEEAKRVGRGDKTQATGSTVSPGKITTLLSRIKEAMEQTTKGLTDQAKAMAGKGKKSDALPVHLTGLLRKSAIDWIFSVCELRTETGAKDTPDLPFPAKAITEGFKEVLIVHCHLLDKVLWEIQCRRVLTDRSLPTATLNSRRSRIMNQVAIGAFKAHQELCMLLKLSHGSRHQAKFLKSYDQGTALYSEMKDLVASGDRSPKGTLLWEANKRVSVALAGRPNPLLMPIVAATCIPFITSMREFLAGFFGVSTKHLDISLDDLFDSTWGKNLGDI